mgnify:CR=1 FL=1
MLMTSTRMTLQYNKLLVDKLMFIFRVEKVRLPWTYFTHHIETCTVILKQFNGDLTEISLTLKTCTLHKGGVHTYDNRKTWYIIANNSMFSWNMLIWGGTACLTRTRLMPDLREFEPHKGSRCFLEQYILPSLIIPGWITGTLKR